jgi:polar amino acid transport system ATP-binding protein
VSPAAPVLEVRGVTKAFGEREVLHGVDLAVSEHGAVALIGASGSGKSTLLRCIDLLEEIDDGDVFLDGKVITDPSVDPVAVRRRLGLVFQAFNLFPHLTALENITMPLRRVRGLKVREAEERAAHALRRVGLLRHAAHYPREMSGGQQQRVAIARALSIDPAVMLFDEPTSALDPELVGEVLAVMREVAESGMTMVVVTHELGFAREVGDLSVFMEAGSIVESGPRGFYDTCSNPRTRQFISAVL